ncbi:MAG: ATP synthase subunit C [Treponema sp.]
MNRRIIILVLFIFSCLALFAAPNEEKNEKEVQAQTASFKYLSAAIAVGVACLAGGFAVGKIGAAAMGAMSEKPELSGKAIPFVGLAEGICLWGFLVALLIILL